MAIVNSVATLVTLFSDVGLNLSVIRSPRGEDDRFLKTVFTLKVIQYSLLTSIILLLVPIFHFGKVYGVFSPDSAYASSDFTSALCIVAIATFIAGFRSIQFEISARNQKVGRQTSIEITSQILSLTFICVTATTLSPSIYALAFANVVSSLTIVSGSYILFSRKKFGFCWDKSAIEEIISFGKWILGSTAIVGISNNLDRILFGALLTGTQMGVYSIAALIFNAMDTVFKRINTALFPAVSRVIRDGGRNLTEVYYKIRFYRDLAIAIPTTMVIVNGDLIIRLLYDERYTEAGYYLQIVSLAHLIECFYYKNQVLISLGQTKVQLELAIKRLIGLLIFIPLGYHFGGITGILLALSARRAIGGWIIYRKFGEYCKVDILKELRTLAIILISLLFWYGVRLYFIDHF